MPGAMKSNGAALHDKHIPKGPNAKLQKSQTAD